jgi:hypothetical protein
MLLARILLIVSTLMFGGFALAFLWNPVATGALVEIRPETAAARIEIRAIYGGFELGLAAFLIWSLLAPERLASGLLINGLVLGFVAVCRLIGVAAEGAMPRPIPMALASEVFLSLFSFAALWRLPR